MPTCREIEIGMNLHKPIGPCVEVWAVWGNISTHTHTAHGQLLFSRNSHIPAVWSMSSRVTACALEQTFEISWSLDNGVKETEEMNLLTSDKNFFINKAISLLYVLLTTSRSSGEWGSICGFLETLLIQEIWTLSEQGKVTWPLDFGLWTQSTKKILLIFFHSGRTFTGFPGWAEGSVRLLTQSCSSLSGINQHQPYKLNKL